MRIQFFDLSPLDRALLRKQSFAHHEVEGTKEMLSEENATDFQEAEIISVFVYSKVTRAVIDAMPNLRLIATRSTGFDHIDTAYAASKGIRIATVPLYGENTVAEHTFALILSLSRNVHKSYVRSQRGDHSIEGLMGFDLKDKTLGVIGAGKIGQHVIRIGRAFGMKVQAYEPHHDDFLSDVLDFTYVDFDTLIRTSDIITLHVPYNTHTHHLVGKAEFSAMKKGSMLINTARGGVVDTEAMLCALESGHLAGVGLDVVEGEELMLEEERLRYNETSTATREAMARTMMLLRQENVVYTPHIAFYSKEALERIMTTTCANIQSFLEGNCTNCL
ncbi:hydroxyacid dehydrogenase [Candidatus Gracilibacteria bacterium CG17_big_fil_post_rev_8_21_14_2_50_48_13]|nr:MAG: hydroxyacid dehydrogenase [Candidatus Gracilibacteria bacterium CG17_big_fil_post_rev_8_21_14_2_50_48_13]